MNAKLKNIIFFILFCNSLLFAQDNNRTVTLLDSIQYHLDTIKNPIDSILPSGSTRQVKLSKDSLDAKVEYGAQDSMKIDRVNNLIHLYGNAFVKYKSLNLKAAYITVDLKNSIAVARVVTDSVGNKIGKAEFSDGAQQFAADSMRYNFKARKGLIYEVVTKQNDIYVHGSRTKFVGAAGDTIKRSDNIAYSEDALFTTCNADHPHFGIHSTQQKVIPDKLIVVGPSNLVIGDVPTPIYLPFAFFPITKGRRQGLIFPKDYEFSSQWGFGLKNVGYFVPLGEHFNLSVTGDVYWKGSWGVNVSSDYYKIYKYRGNVSLGFANRRNEDQYANRQSQKSYSLRWNYSQDSKSHPTRNLQAAVNIQTNNYNSLNRNDARSVLENTLSSNANFTQLFPDRPYTLTASFNHSQNNRTREMTISFPNVNFQMQQIYPFKKEKRIGKERWYEKVAFTYNAAAQNQFRSTDTTLFTNETLRNAQFGIKHTASTNVSFRVLKYFNLSPSVNYKEYWYFKTLNKKFDPTPVYAVDTIYNDDSTSFTLNQRITQYGSLDTILDYGFKPMRQFDAGVNLNTQIFGTIKFKKGWLRGVRHIIKPNVGFSYTPDYRTFGYFDSVQVDSRTDIPYQQYSIFDGGIFGTPSNSGLQMNLNYGFNNIFEAKYRNRKDSVDKKIKLFDNFNINGNYNLAADSLKFSMVSMNGTLRLFKGFSQLNLGMQFDPYIIDSNGRRLNRFLIKEENKLLRLASATLNINTGIRFSELREILKGNKINNTIGRKDNADVVSEDFAGLFDNFSLNHSFQATYGTVKSRDTIVFTNSISVRGRLQLSKGWNIDVGNFGYDFQAKRLSYTDIGFSRDLHCWEMGMRWQPDRGTYAFFIQVKPGSLDFLKVPYNKNNADSFNERF